jgi:hypothetical protein
MSKEMREQIEKFTGLFKKNESVNYPLSNMDDISDIIIKNGVKQFNNCQNNNIISEASLSRLLELNKNTEWVIITAHRTNFNKEQNIQRNRNLREFLNSKKMGPHQLIGHWKECSLQGVDWNKCPKDKIKETFERSYFVPKPKNYDSQEFKNLMIDLMTIDGETQDAIVYSDGKQIYLLGNKGQVYDTFSDLSLNRISQAYSRHIKKHDIPFIFEGLEIPGSNSGRMVMNYENIKYII